MKIIKHGKYFKNGNTMECEYCGCTFKYNAKDIKTAPTSKWFTYTRYLVCPECKSDVHFENKEG